MTSYLGYSLAPVPPVLPARLFRFGWRVAVIALLRRRIGIPFLGRLAGMTPFETSTRSFLVGRDSSALEFSLATRFHFFLDGAAMTLWPNLAFI
jgi:hypothetical protein